jgi:hypothetical protein
MTQELRKLAEAANQDSPEWKWDGRKVDADGYVHIPECSYLVGAICLSDTYEGYQDHCEFIAAANPAAILALLDRVEKAEKDAERYRWLRSPDTDVSLVIDKRTGWVPPDEHVEGVGGYHTYEYRAGEELDTAIDSAMEARK